MFLSTHGIVSSSSEVVIPYSNTKSIELDGVSDYITMGDPTNLSFGNGTTDSPFSISCWFKLQSVGATKWLVTKRLLTSSSASKYEYLLYVGSSGLVGFQLYDANGVVRRARKTSAGIISADTWYNLVGTYNGVGGTNADLGIKIYLNGVRVDNASTNNNTYVAMHNTSEPFKIGQLTDGNIDETAVFSSELSQSEVTSIYNSGYPPDLSSHSNIVSWWRMGDNDTYPTISDNIGSNDGTMQSMTSSSIVPDVPVVFSNTKSLQFDGVSDYVSALAGTTLGGSDNSGTITLWVKPEDLTYNQTLVCLSASSKTRQYLNIGLNSSNGFYVDMRINSTQSSGFFVKADVNPFSVGTWTHLAVVQDGVSPQLYVNGVAVAQTFLVSTNDQKWLNDMDSLDSLNIGRWFNLNVNQNFFKGKIDEFSYFNYDLNSSDIADIYNSGEPTNLSMYSGLDLWYRMGDGDSHPTISDNAGSNDGTMNGMTSANIVTDTP